MSWRKELENTPSPRVSIVIRAKNEEQWIWRCLKAIQAQTLKPYEIIVVDNQSVDSTVELAFAFGATKVLTIGEYSPGKALNLGTDAASGEIICFLSAHCIPKDKDWLEQLVAPLEDPLVAASYGRQLPLPFSNPIDKSDLYAVFRNESRIQKLDGFMNNANSAIRRSVWERIRFDSSVTNVEDRVWGKEVIGAGMYIAYCADACVFHYNGMHKSGQRSDQSPTIAVIEGKLEPLLDLSPYESLFDGSVLPVVFGDTPSKVSEMGDELHKGFDEVCLFLTNPLSIVLEPSRFPAVSSALSNAQLRELRILIAISEVANSDYLRGEPGIRYVALVDCDGEKYDLQLFRKNLANLAKNELYAFENNSANASVDWFSARLLDNACKHLPLVMPIQCLKVLASSIHFQR